MTRATIPTPDAERHLLENAAFHRTSATELQSEATEYEEKAARKREDADRLLNLAQQYEEAVRDLQAHRREHPRKDEKAKA